MRLRLRLAVPMLAIVAVAPIATFNPIKLPRSWAAQVSVSREEARDRWQKTPEIFALMGIAPGHAVADVGAGQGYFTVRLAEAVGETGLVFAVDVSERALRTLRTRAEDQRLSNVRIVPGQADDPCLPHESLDAVLINNAYHEMEAHQAMLGHLRSALRPGGRLVVVDQSDPSRRDGDRARQFARHEIAPALVEADLVSAGFVIEASRDPFIERGNGTSDTWWLIVARRPDQRPAA